ncbi:hypothetical protein [Nocardia sp. NPDC050710]|uniref:hypothetical protein n=1 Tax=Nocardia sp. NPDC050710 TaxID=3157220 RepID=UPI0033C4938B
MRRPDLPAPRYWNQYFHEPRRLVCARCEAAEDWTLELRGAKRYGGLEDPHFGQPLWLRTRCAGHVLWAYNEEHIDELTAYVSAVLRERGISRSNNSMASRLPLWMKRSDNRADVLAGLARLRMLATRSSPADRSDAAY